MRTTVNVRCVLGAIIIVMTMIQGARAAGVEMSGDVSVSGTLSAAAVTGDGSGLTNIPGTALTNASVTQSKLAGSAVGPTQLATNAVTPAKISFYGRVGIVATSGGDYADPATAMEDYLTWCKTPSDKEPCLLKIMPGVYDVKTSPVVMQPYIDIEGSGEKVTIITGAIESNVMPPMDSLVRGADNAEIRFLTVKNVGAGNGVVAVGNYSTSPTLTNVTATASGGVVALGIFNRFSSATMINVTATASGGTQSIGIYNVNASPTMTNVTATASGGTASLGVHNSASSPTMTNVTATASGGTSAYGIFNSNASLTMTNVAVVGKDGTDNWGMYNLAASGTYTILVDRSTFEGSTNSIRNDSEFTLLVGASKLVGGEVNVLGAYSCVGVYKQIGTPPTSYVATGSDCQVP